MSETLRNEFSAAESMDTERGSYSLLFRRFSFMRTIYCYHFVVCSLFCMLCIVCLSVFFFVRDGRRLSRPASFFLCFCFFLTCVLVVCLLSLILLLLISYVHCLSCVPHRRARAGELLWLQRRRAVVPPELV